MEKRLDVFLVDAYGIKSRSKAQALIRNGCVTCNGKVITKTGFLVSETNTIKIIDETVLRYVSRGGLKLEKAIDVFQLDFNEKTILDIGSSTGGFTDCSIQHGAKKVIAVDVGTNIMDYKLSMDERVELHEETDIRTFPQDRFLEIDFIVCDVSFISITTIISSIKNFIGNYDMVLLIKPQFECGADIARKYKGVISNCNIHKQILNSTISKLEKMGFYLSKLTYSPICGGDGNIEYITLFKREHPIETIKMRDIDGVVNEAFKNLKNGTIK